MARSTGPVRAIGVLVGSMLAATLLTGCPRGQKQNPAGGNPTGSGTAAAAGSTTASSTPASEATPAAASEPKRPGSVVILPEDFGMPSGTSSQTAAKPPAAAPTASPTPARTPAPPPATTAAAPPKRTEAEPGTIEDEPEMVPPMQEGTPPMSRRPVSEQLPAAPASTSDDESYTDARDELRRRYRVTVAGDGADDPAVGLVLTAVRQFRPEEVADLHVDITSADRLYGVLGTYSVENQRKGRIVLFNNRIQHVALHEVAHHMTLLKRRDVSTMILRTTMPGGVVELRNVPSRYANTSDAEFLAEWVSNVREIQKNLPGYAPFRLSTFNPDPVAVRVTDAIFAER